MVLPPTSGARLRLRLRLSLIKRQPIGLIKERRGRATVTAQIVPQKLKPSEGPTQTLDPSTRTTVAMCLRVLHSALQFEVVSTFDLATTRGVIRRKTHTQGFCAEWAPSNSDSESKKFYAFLILLRYILDKQSRVALLCTTGFARLCM